MCKKDEGWRWKISSYHEKRNEKTETLNLMRLREMIEKTLFRWGIIDESEWIEWFFRSKSWKKWFEFERTNESNSDAFADAFADENFFFSDDAVDAINCKMIT